MNNGDRCVVFYEAWQMECCGEVFRVGETVRWPVLGRGDFTLLGDEDADYLYEAHSRDFAKLMMLEGRVERVQILYRRLRPCGVSPTSLVPVEDGESVSEETIEAHGGEMLENGMRAEGYMVELSGFSLRPAEKKDITYR